MQTAVSLARYKRRVVIQKPLEDGDVLRLASTLGGRIALMRHQLGMTQHDVARSVGKSQPLVSKWERDNAVPGDEDIKALAKTFRCTESYLLTTPRLAA